MSIYSIVLFFHITGALGFFIVQGVEWIGLSQIRSATRPEEARAVLGAIKRANLLAFVSILTLIITGAYMTLAAWRDAPWILVMIAALVLEFMIFMALSRPRVTAIERALATEESALSETFHARVNHPILWASITTRTALLLGIVFLKIAKPDLSGSLLAIAIAFVLGFVVALPELRPERGQAGLINRTSVALLASACVVALALFAAKSIAPGAIPAKTASHAQIVPTQPSGAPAGPDASKQPTATQSGGQTVPTGLIEAPTETPPTSLSVQAPTPSPVTASQEGAALLQSRCTQCHSIEKVQQAKKDRAGWQQTLTIMKLFGAKLNDTEQNILLDYLTKGNQP